MDSGSRFVDGKMLLCVCPSCNNSRQKVAGKFTIVRRGHERNGLARFLCMNCNKWFNESTGETMKWLDRY